jgi:hypothetical protein
MQITVTSEKESTHEAYAHWGRFGQERVSTTVWIVMNSPSGGSVYPGDRWLQTVLEKIEPDCEIGMESCGGAHHWRGSYRHADFGDVDRAAVRQTVRQEQQERRQRCRVLVLMRIDPAAEKSLTQSDLLGYGRTCWIATSFYNGAVMSRQVVQSRISANRQMAVALQVSFLR